MVTTLSPLAGGLAAGTVDDSTTNVIAGAQAGQNAVENNNFNLSAIAPKGLQDVGASMTSLYANTNMVDENGNVLNPITEEERQYAMHKLVTGTMPEGQDISKAIVDGYTNGVLIADAWYLGPAASIGKVAVGSALSGGANAAYQWYDLSQPGNENKTYDYWSTTAALVTGGLAPGRGIWANLGIAAGGTLFTDGPDKGALTGTSAGWVFGTTVGLIAPPLFDPVLGSGSAPVGDIIGAIGGEFISNTVKDEINEKNK
ncbi:VENN motif-containing pre-toxin protein [Samsonia erythrinae]|uniref:VENN motif-containing pre-toxin protein n=4 Tax=Samsonia erythrinae TaxID=160434 RepID=A0A4R3VLY9_9GAMM|nr:VENN motif-containing pre-toxin protein [Samsonia erythrinae]